MHIHTDIQTNQSRRGYLFGTFYCTKSSSQQTRWRKPNLLFHNAPHSRYIKSSTLWSLKLIKPSIEKLPQMDYHQWIIIMWPLNFLRQTVSPVLQSSLWSRERYNIIAADLRQLLTELVQFLLQWSFLSLRLRHFRSDLTWKRKIAINNKAFHTSK